jgi:hypothetical protein
LTLTTIKMSLNYCIIFEMEEDGKKGCTGEKIRRGGGGVAGLILKGLTGCF